jgi:hypothetical protein
VRLPRFSSDEPPDGLVAHEPQRAQSRPDGDSLLGAWLATRWQYTSHEEPLRSLDVVTDLGGSVTLSLSKGTYVLTYDAAGRGPRSIGGVVEVRPDALLMQAGGAGGPETIRFRLADQTLSLSSEASSWDFDGAGEQPADFVAVLVRL